ncbi:MAG: R3H domain-containing nucleic acid-binding protein [Myxococcota bacterium]|nr:R3H domain-containing nucleic acid-binding protein [Myxococcota bacterium]
MMSNAREFTGSSAAEAAINACEEFGVNRSDIDYDVISQTGEGIDREVVISVKLKEGVEPGSANIDSGDERPERRETRSRDRGGRDRGRGRDRDRGGRDRDRGGRDRDRGGRSQRDAEPSTNVDEALELEVVPAEPVELPAAFEGERSERGSKAVEVLSEIVQRAGWDVSVLLVDDTEDQIELTMHGDDETCVIGKRGDVLLALQFIINRIAARASEGDQLIVLDAAGYRTRRRDALSGLAKELAKKAQKNSKIVKLSPMSSHDRRVVHQALTDVDGVDTRSEGDGVFRQLLIIPMGYEKRPTSSSRQN